jgi:hexosaminidase
MKYLKNSLYILILSFHILSVSGRASSAGNTSILLKEGIGVIPYPGSVVLTGDDFIFDDIVNIRIDMGTSKEDQFSAAELCRLLRDQWDITGRIVARSGMKEFTLTHKNAPPELGDQGYRITISHEKIIITAQTSTGLFYGVQTIIQLVQKVDNKLFIKGMTINDQPDILVRAVHYDTKHFQEKKEYVKNFGKLQDQYADLGMGRQIRLQKSSGNRCTRSIYPGRNAGVYSVCKTISY